MKRLRGTVVAAFATAFLVANAASAGIVTFDLCVEFSGGQEPQGSPPWLRATFMDRETGVELRLENLLHGTGEFLGSKGWLFNYDPELDPNSLTIQQTGGDTATVSTGTDAFSADGDGLFDIQFGWDANVFMGDETAVFTLTSLEEGFDAMSFDFLSAPGNQGGGGVGRLPTAAHVQGIYPGDGSGWVTIPAPGAVLLGAIGVGLIVVVKRKL